MQPIAKLIRRDAIASNSATVTSMSASNAKRRRSAAAPSSSTRAEGRAIPDAWLRRIWERMCVMYGGAWASENGEAPQHDDGSHTVAGKVWRDALAGLESEQLAEGLRLSLIRHPEWPPKLGQFRELCMGVPALREVRFQLRLPPSGRVPFMRVLVIYLDKYRWERANERAAEKLVTDAYELAREHILRGDPIPDPVLELGASPAAHAMPYEPPPVEQRAAITERWRRETFPPE